MKALTTLCLLFFIFTFLTQLNAQVDIDDQVIITTESDEIVEGVLTDIENGYYHIYSERLGNQQIHEMNVKKIKRVVLLPKDDRGFIIDYINQNKYYVGPTGFSLPKGALTYEAKLLLFNTFTYGVSDRLDVDFSFELLSLLDNEFPWLSMSANYVVYSKEKTKGFAGVRLMDFEFSSLWNSESTHEFVKMVYGGASYGSQNTNLTLLAGYGFGADRSLHFLEDNFVPVMLMGKLRVSDRVSVLTENYFFKSIQNRETEDNYNFSAGIRFHFKNNNGSFGLSAFTTSNPVGVFPYFDFILKL